MKQPEKIFHATVAHNNPTSNLPTPFQMVGSGVKRIVKGAGRFVLHNFVDPSIKVAQIKDAKLNKMKKDLESGDYLHN